MYSITQIRIRNSISALLPEVEQALEMAFLARDYLYRHKNSKYPNGPWIIYCVAETLHKMFKTQECNIEDETWSVSYSDIYMVLMELLRKFYLLSKTDHCLVEWKLKSIHPNLYEEYINIGFNGKKMLELLEFYYVIFLYNSILILIFFINF